MFRSVKNAWMILMDNGCSTLYVQFEEPYQGPVPEFYPDITRVPEIPTPFYVEADGIVEYGMFDGHEAGKMYWTKPAIGVFNAASDIAAVNIVEVVQSDRHKAFPALYGLAITSDFADAILEQFDLPFGLNFEIKTDPKTCTGAFIQKSIDTTQIVTHAKEGQMVISRAIVDPCTGEAIITATTKDKERNPVTGGFNEFPELYKGMTQAAFRDYWAANVLHS